MSAQPARGYLSISEVLAQLRAEFPDISVSKIRFLETEGLIAPARAPSGYRRFAAADVERLRYILTAQRDQYLPLRVIKERLARATWARPGSECGRGARAVRPPRTTGGPTTGGPGTGAVRTARPTGPPAADPPGAARPGRHHRPAAHRAGDVRAAAQGRAACTGRDALEVAATAAALGGLRRAAPAPAGRPGRRRARDRPHRGRRGADPEAARRRGPRAGRADRRRAGRPWPCGCTGP